MANFCGKCGSRLDKATGLCPRCDANELNKHIQAPTPKQDTISESAKPLSKKEAKKKRKADKKAAKKVKKKEKWAAMTLGQKIRRIILKLFLWLIGTIIFAFGVISVLSYFNVIDIPIVTAYREGKLLEVINERNIIIEEETIIMTNETEGTATIIVTLPDYELLFENAVTAKNPDNYLLKALIFKDYETKEFEVSASVTVENGEKVVHSDEAIHQLLEECLVDAINALSEAR